MLCTFSTVLGPTQTLTCNDVFTPVVNEAKRCASFVWIYLLYSHIWGLEHFEFTSAYFNSHIFTHVVRMYFNVGTFCIYTLLFVLFMCQIFSIPPSSSAWLRDRKAQGGITQKPPVLLLLLLPLPLPALPPPPTSQLWPLSVSHSFYGWSFSCCCSPSLPKVYSCRSHSLQYYDGLIPVFLIINYPVHSPRHMSLQKLNAIGHVK